MPRQRRWPWALLALLILAMGFAGFGALHKFKPRAAVKPMVRQLPVVRAQAMQLHAGGLPVNGNGLVQPRAQVTLAAEVSARIKTVSPSLVTGGQISGGDVLISLDDAPFKAALSQAAAERRSSRAALALARQSVGRTKNLIEKGFLSRQTLDERIAALDQARAAYQRSNAMYEQRLIDVSRTSIIAPFSGRVLSESVNAGDTVQPGRELARIFDDSSLEVAVSLTSADMALVDNAWGRQSGAAPASAVVRVDHGDTTYEWDAIVERVEAAIDPATRTFNVVVTLVEPKAPGRPAKPTAGRQGPPLVVGMYADVRIAGRDQGKYLSVPRRALRDGNKLWLVDAQSTISIVTVRVLSEFDDQVAVALGDIDPSARVVVSDLRVVTPGMPVRISNEAAPARPSERPTPAASARKS